MNKYTNNAVLNDNNLSKAALTYWMNSYHELWINAHHHLITIALIAEGNKIHPTEKIERINKIYYEYLQKSKEI